MDTVNNGVNPSATIDLNIKSITDQDPKLHTEYKNEDSIMLLTDDDYTAFIYTHLTANPYQDDMCERVNKNSV